VLFSETAFSLRLAKNDHFMKVSAKVAKQFKVLSSENFDAIYKACVVDKFLFA